MNSIARDLCFERRKSLMTLLVFDWLRVRQGLHTDRMIFTGFA